MDNMVLAGIWCGHTEPLIRVFVKSFVEEVEELCHHSMQLSCLFRLLVTLQYIVSPDCSAGLTVKLANGDNIFLKVNVLELVADLPAKAQLLNQIQYNGAFGCSVSDIYLQHPLIIAVTRSV